MGRKRNRKLPGRFCWCCGRRGANERFSQTLRVCSSCVGLGREEIAYRQQVRNIDRLLTFDGFVRRTQRRTFDGFLAHPDARVREYAKSVAQREERQRRERAAYQAEEAALDDSPTFDEAAAELRDGEGVWPDDDLPF